MFWDTHFETLYSIISRIKLALRMNYQCDSLFTLIA